MWGKRTIRNKHSRGDIELNSQSLGIVEIFYLGDTIARRGARSRKKESGVNGVNSEI